MRRHWAQKHINRPLGQWQHVIFCDESRFMLFRIDNRLSLYTLNCRVSMAMRYSTWSSLSLVLRGRPVRLPQTNGE